jgi:hypothetical protein
MNHIHRTQVPFLVEQAPQLDFSHWQGSTTPERPPVAHSTLQQPTFGQMVLGGLVLLGVGYIAYKVLFQSENRTRHCSECGRKSHTARGCPFILDRRRFASSVEKTGWCECCSRWFPKTQLHHYGGRADDSKAMEMCHECHVHCGHNGHTQNLATKPRYCRVAA